MAAVAVLGWDRRSRHPAEGRGVTVEVREGLDRVRQFGDERDVGAQARPGRLEQTVDGLRDRQIGNVERVARQWRRRERHHVDLHATPVHPAVAQHITGRMLDRPIVDR